MTQVDTFGLYVRRRLEHWGEVFALHKDCDYLGHQSKNMLQVLIEHRGEMPERVQGFKPLEVDDQAMQIELIVSEIGKWNIERASVIRAYYCGSGRRLVERKDQAEQLIAAARREKRSALSKQRFVSVLDCAVAEVRGSLLGVQLGWAA